MINVVQLDSQMQEALKDVVKLANQTVICPFKITQGVYDIVNGAVDYKNIYGDTNSQDNTSQISSFENNFKKILKGDNALIFRWRDSTFIDVENPGSAANIAKKKYQVGLTIQAYNTSANYNTVVTESLNSANTKEMEITSSITFIILPLDGNNPLFSRETNTNLLYDGFALPQFNNFLYYPKDITEYYFNDKLQYIEATFERINNLFDLERINISQIVSFSAPGEGYAWPQFNRSINDDKNYIVELDSNKLENRPITRVQIELDNPGAISNVMFIGRRIDEGTDQDQTLNEWGFLLNYEFKRAVGNPYSGVYSPSDDYRLSSDISFNISTYFEDYRQVWYQQYDDQVHKRWEGHLLDGNYTQTQNSNPVTEGDNVPYWNAWNPDIGTRNFQTVTPYAEEQYTLTGQQKAEKIWNNNFFSFLHIESLPLAIRQVIPFKYSDIPGLSDIPILTGIYKTLFKGLGYFGWQNVYNGRILAPKLVLFSELNYNKFIIETVYQGGKNPAPMPFTAFGETKPSEILGKNTLYNVLSYTLTDELSSTQYLGKTILTKDLGKVDDSNSNYCNVTYGTSNCPKWNPVKMDTKKSYTGGWAIDKVYCQAIAMTTFRITYFDKDDSILGSYKYTSSSYITGSTRDWVTIIKTSDWESGIPVYNPGGQPPQPIPPEQIYPSIKSPIYVEREIISPIGQAGAIALSTFTIDIAPVFGLTDTELETRYNTITFNINNRIWDNFYRDRPHFEVQNKDYQIELISGKTMNIYLGNWTDICFTVNTPVQQFTKVSIFKENGIWKLLFELKVTTQYIYYILRCETVFNTNKFNTNYLIASKK